MKSQTKHVLSEEMANQVFQYLRKACGVNVANMYSRYRGLQVCYLIHSLNVAGRSAADCCQEAVNFFSTVQLPFTFFILKLPLENS